MILSSTRGGPRREIQGTKATWNTPAKSKYQTDRRVFEKDFGLITGGHNEQTK